MAFDLTRLVMERSQFRGKPLHLLTLIFIADRQNKDGRAFATRERLMVDTGMSDGALRKVLRDLVKSGEATGGGGGRGNKSAYAINAERLKKQVWRRAEPQAGKTDKPAIPWAGLDEKPAHPLASIATQTCQPADANLPTGGLKPANRRTPSNKGPGVTRNNQERERTRARSLRAPARVAVRSRTATESARDSGNSKTATRVHAAAKEAAAAMNSAFIGADVTQRIKPTHPGLNRALQEGVTVQELVGGAGEAACRHQANPLGNVLAYAFKVADDYRAKRQRSSTP